MTHERALLYVMLVVATFVTQFPGNRTTPMSVKWRQLLRKAWRDVVRQIDITLRHHERQNYDTVSKEVNSRINQLKELTLLVSCLELFIIQL